MVIAGLHPRSPAAGAWAGQACKNVVQMPQSQEGSQQGAQRQCMKAASRALSGSAGCSAVPQQAPLQPAACAGRGTGQQGPCAGGPAGALAGLGPCSHTGTPQGHLRTALWSLRLPQARAAGCVNLLRTGRLRRSLGVQAAACVGPAARSAGRTRAAGASPCAAAERAPPRAASA